MSQLETQDPPLRGPANPPSPQDRPSGPNYHSLVFLLPHYVLVQQLQMLDAVLLGPAFLLLSLPDPTLQISLLAWTDRTATSRLHLYEAAILLYGNNASTEACQ